MHSDGLHELFRLNSPIEFTRDRSQIWIDNPTSMALEPSPVPILEATGWITNQAGQIERVAHHSPHFAGLNSEVNQTR